MMKTTQEVGARGEKLAACHQRLRMASCQLLLP